MVEISDEFQQAQPFPHQIIDGMWDVTGLRAIIDEFPSGDDPRWITYAQPEEIGKRAGASNMWGPTTKHWFETMRGPEMVKRVEELTGISPLTPDDIGGGMHMTGPDGRLAMHIDFNYHPSLPLMRRINFLVFLNDEWEKEWGGTLYLGAEREVEVLPLFNRTAIFATSDHSWHGHPEPIVGEHWRKSLAVYYYTPIPDDFQPPAHTTVWLPQS